MWLLSRPYRLAKALECATRQFAEISCFCELEFCDFKDLVLISFRLAREARKGRRR
jgi:hypothetical protein